MRRVVRNRGHNYGWDFLFRSVDYYDCVRTGVFREDLEVLSDEHLLLVESVIYNR